MPLETTNASTAHVNFDGWVIVFQAGPDALLLTDIELIDTDHQDAPLCETEHQFARDAKYSLVNPEEAQVLCQACLDDLHRNASTRPDYVMGAVPAN